MRIWSVGLRYLDQKGLVALWRETLLAQAVLAGNTKGYKNHSQLIRFKQQSNPLNCVSYYLSLVHIEACRRGYKFDASKILPFTTPAKISVTSGQVEYEYKHLKNKLLVRDPARVANLPQINVVTDLFSIVDGPIESWEII